MNMLYSDNSGDFGFDIEPALRFTLLRTDMLTCLRTPLASLFFLWFLCSLSLFYTLRSLVILDFLYVCSDNLALFGPKSRKMSLE